MKIWLRLFSLTLGTVLACLGAPPPEVNVCPQAAVNGNAAYQAAVAASGTCNLTVVVNADGSTTSIIAGNPNAYDGDEDQLIGVVNNGPVPVTVLHVSATGPVFRLDNDGICFYTPFVSNAQPCKTVSSNNYLGGASSFNNINANLTSGDVNFSPGIPPGGTSYFSLEEPPVAGALTITVDSPFDLFFLWFFFS